jgi:hypothetical protein
MSDDDELLAIISAAFRDVAVDGVPEPTVDNVGTA